MTADRVDGNGWDEWKRHVLAELQSIRKMREDISFIRAEIAALKVKSGIWGAIGAGVMIIVSIVLQRLTN